MAGYSQGKNKAFNEKSNDKLKASVRVGGKPSEYLLQKAPFIATFISKVPSRIGQSYMCCSCLRRQSSNGIAQSCSHYACKPVCE